MGSGTGAGPSGVARLARTAGAARLAAAGAALSLAAAAGAAAILATKADGWVLGYGLGPPVAVPWLSAGLSAALAVAGLRAVVARRRRAAGAPWAAAVAVLALVTCWSVTMLPFDALRIVRLVPLPVSGWGTGLRLLLLVAAAAAIVPGAIEDRRRRGRCPECWRGLPGRFAAVPRWVAVVAVVAALPYPLLRTCWALECTVGTTGGPIDMSPALAWGVVVAGSLLVVVAAVLLVGRGPAWLRAVLGLGGIAVGQALAAIGGSGAVAAVGHLAAEGAYAPVEAGGHLVVWPFVVVYGSWAVAGLAVAAAGWRYWVRRREDCAGCRPLLARPSVRLAA